MGATTSRLIWKGRPDVWPSLRPLIGWSRDSLLEAFETFRAASLVSVALDSAAFSRILGWHAREQVEAAFEALRPKGGRVDFLQVIGAMVIASDQHFVSKTSMLFSMHDLGGTGAIMREDFCIIMLTLFKGLACFIKGQPSPEVAEAEVITDSVFGHIDMNGDGLVTLGECVTFAYRSLVWRHLTCSFPSDDPRLFEEQVHFDVCPLQRMTGQESVVSHSAFSDCASEYEALRCTIQATRLRHRIRTTPDPLFELDKRPSAPLLQAFAGSGRSGPSRRRRPWRRPSVVSRATAWNLWRFFLHLASEDCSMDAEDLLRILSDDLRAGAVLEEAVAMKEDSGHKPLEANQILQHFCLQISGGHVRERLQALIDVGTRSVSLRAFCCIVWPLVPESELETLIDWCKAYQMKRVLSQVIAEMREDWEPVVDATDIVAMLEILDGNGDGKLMVDDFRVRGRVNLNMAKQITAAASAAAAAARSKSPPPRAPKAPTKPHTLSKAELKSIILQMDMALTEQFKMDPNDPDPAGRQSPQWASTDVNVTATKSLAFFREELIPMNRHCSA